METETTPGDWLTLKEAAIYLRIPVPSLRNLCKRRAVTHCRIDRLNWRFKVADLDDYLLRNTVRAKPVRG